MQITYKNNWCNHEYYSEGKRVEPKKVRVLPDGVVLDVVDKIETGSYGDMGHTYTYNTKQFFVLVDTAIGTVQGPSLSALLKEGKTLEVVK